jgi:hypothetical protein
MPVGTTLVTNEVRDGGNAEVEFQLLRTTDREVVYGKKSETPSKPYRLSISHEEVGSGIGERRRSRIRFDKVVASDVDSTKLVTVTAYLVLDIPVGAMNASTEFNHVLANLLSFCATLGGATTTYLADGTGNGADLLLGGKLSS